ncbi:MAG: 50S ribosomal protein L18 [Candidatus Altiarchaeales archaeon]|nr:MAG: 50S ribosomal protein L18 [Candidatus Altiarchaeales archaeon]RLI95216.1 MAG: 50S ribosomal protein L18 [Candidatus Altiarchaeales archaeon]RLI95250.1 MAG: 50S ribosomal protein L18 [Candidatus Altiarchaeales archaeon]HDO82637.1 50S ribosomal protein L18 [Candidatus Altiarchaeales archaeon]HEX55286.1 50S ribosomal protein L18 [Candidatus Altiarchaeales archaeon]
MAKKPTYVVKFRRRREGKTNYKKRLNLLKSNRPRLVVRKSNRYINVQIINYNPDGDVVVASANSKELDKFGWEFYKCNTPSAYLTGLICGYRGISRGVNNAILDIGLYRSVKSSRLYAALKGAVDAGLNIPFDKDMLPSEERISGRHIAEYREIKDIEVKFNDVKNKIIESFKKKKLKNDKK